VFFVAIKGSSKNFVGMHPTGFIPVAAMMGENSRFSPNHGTTGASPVGTSFAISATIYEEPIFLIFKKQIVLV